MDTPSKPCVTQNIQHHKRRWLSLLAKGGAVAGLAASSPLAAAVLANRLAERGPAKKFLLLFHPGGAPRNYLNTIATKPLDTFGKAVALLAMSISKPGSHGNTYMAAGASSFNASQLNSSTIDQQIADTVGHLTPLRSMELGVLNETSYSLCQSKAQMLRGIDQPALAQQHYFARFSASPSGGVISPYERRKTLLAAHQQGLDQILLNISSDERFKLEAHLAAIENLHTRLDYSDKLVGRDGPCGNLVYTQGTSPLNLYRAQGDIAVTALACGLTNVASIQFSNTQASWLPNDGTEDAVAVPGDHHWVLHGGMTQYIPAMNEYMNKGVAHIINQLMQAGIFHETVVLCVSDMGDGTSNSPSGGPITVASGISGFKGIRQNLSHDHYKIFPDVIRLLGLEWAINQTIYNYGNGGIVV
ncbi:MAG: hypothetical protein RL497_646 [Pseudomonadota bacterium]|jgi:hypothetical protein